MQNVFCPLQRNDYLMLGNHSLETSRQNLDFIFKCTTSNVCCKSTNHHITLPALRYLHFTDSLQLHSNQMKKKTTVSAAQCFGCRRWRDRATYKTFKHFFAAHIFVQYATAHRAKHLWSALNLRDVTCKHYTKTDKTTSLVHTALIEEMSWSTPSRGQLYGIFHLQHHRLRQKLSH